MVVLGILILTILSVGILRLAYGAALRTRGIHGRTAAQLAAEAGYEEAVCWMSTEEDVLGFLSPATGLAEVKTFVSDNADFPESSYDCSVSFDRFLENRPVYKIVSNGYSYLSPVSGGYTSAGGRNWSFSKTVSVDVVQAISGWDMGRCTRPDGFSELNEKRVEFTNADDLEMPLHINYSDEDPDRIDIYIDNVSKLIFKKKVSMGESRYRPWGRDKDKYRKVINLFEGGIYFDQPDSKVTSQSSIDKKVTRFKDSTEAGFRRKPEIDNTGLPQWQPALQLEFYIKNDVGMMRTTNHCAVYCPAGGEYDYMLDFDDAARVYKKYNIFSYHCIKDENIDAPVPITDSYVKRQAKSPDGEKSAPEGGQIFVDGNIIIGGLIRSDGKISISGDGWYNSRFKGKLVVVATGNIWIVSPIEYDDLQDLSKGFPLPAQDNPNVLGLFSQRGVVKVVDPSQLFSRSLPPDAFPVSGYEYKPVALIAGAGGYWKCVLPEPMVVQAAITVCGGGWGAENVDRRINSDERDNLVVAGSVTEAVRALVADPASFRGFNKHYYFDQRLLTGILPGDLGLQSKFIPAPGGWRDYQP